MKQEVDSVRQGVEALEAEAARLLGAAQARGDEILHAARREADALATAALALDALEAECAELLAAAEARAREIAARAEADAEALRAHAAGKMDECVRQVVAIVSGNAP